MPTGKQVRAARVLAGWDAEHLAEKTGLTAVTILKIEREEATARPATMERIVRAFDEHRIEFLDDLGVRYRPEGLDILNGPDGWAAFFDYVYEFLKKHGGLVCVSGADEAQFAAHHGEDHASMHIKRMNKLIEKRKDIEFKVLLQEGDTNFMANSYCAYRWQDRDSFVPTPFYVFGDNLALITFDAKPAPKVMVIRSEAFAAAYRKQFHIAWEAAKEASNKE